MVRWFGFGLVSFWLCAASCAQGIIEDDLNPPALTGGAGSACPDGKSLCNGACIDLANDAANCGACGKVCDLGLACRSSQCGCAEGSELCGSTCANLMTDGSNCGACGVTCEGQVCWNGACTTECTTGTQCGTSCVDVKSDVHNCGGCAIACLPDQTCDGGSCACAAGRDLCAGSCVDLTIDPANCGACGAVCPPEIACLGGECDIPAPETGGAPTGGAPTGGDALGGGPMGGTATGGRIIRPTGGGFATGGGFVFPQGGTGGTSNVGGSTPTAEYSVEAGAFVTVCSWHGFAWTGAGPNNLSSITPQSFDSVAAGGPLCASGTVGADANYSGYAMIGINIGQQNTGGDEPPNAEISPTGTGIYVSVTNNASNDLRIQIQDSLGGENASHRWCALYNGPGVIPWSSFNTQCWDNAGSAYNKEPINAVLVMVPGSNVTDTMFNFCVDEIRPQGEPGCSGGLL